MPMFTDLTNGNILPKIDIDSLPEVKISSEMKSRLKRMFESSGDINNVKIMDYTSSFHVRKSGNTVIFPNQYYLIAVYYFNYATALVTYFSFFDEKIRDNRNFERIVYEKKFDQLQMGLFKDQSERDLFVNFLSNLGKDFVNKDNESVKSRPTIDVFGSCLLNKISVPNVSSSILGETIYYLSMNLDVYESLKKELSPELTKENVLVTSESAAGFLMSVLKKTLENDSDFSLMAKKFNEKQVSLSVNGFVFGRNVKQLPTRESDYDSTVLWRYNGNEYCGYKEFYPVNMVRDFFPEYNESYKGKFRLEEKDGKYSMFELRKNQFNNNGTRQVESVYNFSQIIYYGVPGCGKSNKIKELLQDVPEKNKVRVVFHPEYTNADFIGQILPKVNGHVTYEFTAGPFAQIIKKAYLNPNEKFYLVIEEINRGNAAAIFGDTFQLLDRLKAGETDSLGNDSANACVNTFTEGWSQYFVQNDDVNEYIRKAVRAADGKYEESTENKLPEIEIKNIRFTANTAIRLPPNLSILATMNTSDQNVFTLDNAFQRRFDMELIRNEFDMTKDAARDQYDSEIDDTGITWGKFWTWINGKITATLKGLSSTEDKRIGVWFVSNVNGKIDDKIFAEKVLKYLWDDVFKFKRKDVFVDDIDTLETLIDRFEKAEGAARFDVFKKDATFNG